MMISAAAQALGADGLRAFGGDLLQQQVADQSEELRRKRQQEAKQAGFSPAGIALVDFGRLSVPRAP